MKKMFIRGGKMSCLLIFLNISILSAQDVPPPPNDGNEPGVPIDGGASLLAAAGVAYGVKKYRDFRKNQGHKSENEL